MNTKQNIEDQDWKLLAKSIYDENTGSHSEEITSDGDCFTREEKNQILKMAKQVDLYFNRKKFPSETAWEKVNSRIRKQPSMGRNKIRHLISNPLFRIAATILFAALLLVSAYKVFYTPFFSVEMVEATSNHQVLNKVLLPDGTCVCLNSDTKIRYPQKFGLKTREVSVEGEAFFEVKPNKDKPFIIHAGKAQIKVLGTSFNVSAYPEAKLVEVIVETGQVQVINQAAETKQVNQLILTPGDKGTLVYSSNSLHKMQNQDPNFLAWKTHNLKFNATSLGEVITTLEKVYKVNIRLADQRLNGLPLTAQFNDYPLDFVLKVIETTFKIEAQKIDGQYILKIRS